MRTLIPVRKLVPVLAGLLVAGLPGALPVLAQGASPPVKQRAPGVPLAPRAGEAARPVEPDSVAPGGEKRWSGSERAQVRPERDPPMPRPVPSIIAP